MKTTKRIFSVLFAIFAVSIATMGQATKLQDLKDARAGQADMALENRGYTLTHSEQSGYDDYGYWWSSSAKIMCLCSSEQRPIRVDN